MSPSAFPSPYVPGHVIDGKYRIVEVLGAGRSGIVLGAKHIALDVDVAVKVLLPKLQKNGVLRERFLREARSAARLTSQHVTKILDVGSDADGAPYIVMERLRGIDLETLVARRGVVDERLAIELVLQACDAVAEAHTEGIAHRDLELANLFLVDGRVKILDLGLSTGIDERSARSDVRALGMVLHRLLTGVDPASGPVPPLSRGIRVVVRRCLAEDPIARFANAHELRDALRAICERASDRIAIARPVRHRRPTKLKLALAGLVVLGLAAGYTQRSAAMITLPSAQVARDDAASSRIIPRAAPVVSDPAREKASRSPH